MSVTDGQTANQTTFNTAFVSRTQDTNTVGKIDLANTDTASGSTVTNAQREINSLNAYTGRPAGTAKDATPVWTSNEVGTSVDTLKARLEALTVLFDEVSGHTHAGTGGNGGPLVVASGSVAGIISTGSQTLAGDKTFSGAVNVTGNLTPSASFILSQASNSQSGTAITLTTPTTIAVRLTNASLVSITGITAPTVNTLVVLKNTTGATITIINNSGTVSEKILTGSGTNLSMVNNSAIFLYYDTTQSIWMIIGGSGSGGGAYTTQNFTTSSGIVPTSSGFQRWRWTGSSATTYTNSISPSSLTDAEIITILGTSDTNYLLLTHSDISNGFLLNGDWYGYRGSQITLQWDATLARFVEVSRNG